MMRTEEPRPVRLSEYRPPDWLVETVDLDDVPGIGPKTAQRLTFFLLKRPVHEVQTLADSLTQLKARIVHCRVCFNVTEEDPCRICSDPQRDQRILCIVEEPNDLLALERTGEFRGRYHVLQGAISPIEGVLPDQLRIKELLYKRRYTIVGIRELLKEFGIIAQQLGIGLLDKRMPMP